MSLLEAELAENRRWARVGDFYEITRKPRGLDASQYTSIPFAPMETIPQGGAFEPTYTWKAPRAITSGTYFEKADILVAKITPSFENGKQAFVLDLPAAFGYATTEVIPLRPKHRGHDRRLLFYYLLHPDIRAFVAEKMEGTTGRQRIPENVLLDLVIPEINAKEQTTIADALHLVQQSMLVETRSLDNCFALKRVGMRELFTRGLRGEAQKETAIGFVPESWETSTIDDATEIISSRMSYSTLLSLPETNDDPAAVKVIGIKVADMNRVGPETPIREAELVRDLNVSAVRYHCAPPGVIVFPKNGAAVATNKKRVVAHWSVFDPNVMGLFAREGLSQDYLFHWIQGFDLTSIVSPGPVPHFNKSDLARVRIPLPPSLDEQGEIVEILDAIDQKIDLHQRKRAVLEELFKTLLYKLMTGEIGVADLDLSALKPAAKAEVAA